jgi:hypothetical protein
MFVREGKGMKSKKAISLGIITLSIIFIMKVSTGVAAPLLSTSTLNWWPLPPYNTLWPLWSPLLSPPNALGVPQPIVTSLTPDTILPIQPGLTWDPNLDYPWLLYNTPTGMVYYDPIFGIDLWPPKYLNPFGVPLPIDLSLIAGWSTLKPTSTAWLTANVPVGNNTYYTTYPQFAPLLDTSGILGLPILLP